MPFDDQAKPDVGVANAKNIIADKEILAVIGHLNSGVAIPSSEVYKDVNLAMISPANTNPTVTDRGYPNVNRVCGRDDVQGVVGSEFAHGTLKAKSAYIIHDKTTYGQGVAEFFKADAEKKGIKVLGFEGTEEKSNFDPDHHPPQGQEPRPHLLRRDLRAGGAVLQAGAREGREGQVPRPRRARLVRPGQDRRQDGGRHELHLGGRPVSRLPAGQAVRRRVQEEVRQEPRAVRGPGLRRHRHRPQGASRPRPRAARRRRREDVAAAVRKVKHTGITGAIEFDDKGDPKKALYFVLQVASDNPEKWGDNKEVKRLTIAAPAAKK